MSYSSSQQPQPQRRIRQFCPLIIYHDNPSEQLEMKLNANKQHDRTAIDRHRDKTNEMLEHNAQFWNEKSNGSSPGLVEFEADCLDKDIKVSPSTSTTSNISSSSSSSGDSIATIEHPASYPSRMADVPTVKTTATSVHSYYTSIEEEKYYPMISRKQSKSKSTTCNIATSPIISPTSATSTTPTTTPSTNAKNDANTVKRRRGNLPKEVTEFLRKWLIQHKKHPYPAEKEKADLARHTGLTVNQISNWFINARRRILQPMLESENLTAQMMAYPELVNQQHHHSPAVSAFSEPPRRRRHDFYTYQRDFASPTMEHPSPPPLHHHHHPSMHHHHEQQQYHHPHYYPEHEQEHPSRFHRTRLVNVNDHYHQLSMR
ncbi:Homeobox protein tos8, variant 2 [Mucor circinelloides]